MSRDLKDSAEDLELAMYFCVAVLCAAIIGAAILLHFQLRELIAVQERIATVAEKSATAPRR